MAANPKKSVHWNTNDSLSDLGSPSFASITSDSCTPPSSLEYVNAQLVAHGFAAPPGLSFDGISNASSQRIANCFLELLGQRTNDMARTEDLSTKLRVLQYDNERLQSMCRIAQAEAEKSEREMNIHKSRLEIANKSMQAAEAAHKMTSAELQRIKSSLQTARALHQAELRKKEGEIERLIGKKSKGRNAHGRNNEDDMEPTASGQAEYIRGQLSTENIKLKKLVLRTVNQLHALMYKIQNPGSVHEPTPLKMNKVLPLHLPESAEQKVTSMLNSFEDTIAALSQQEHGLVFKSNSSQEAEIARLQEVISSFPDEIERLQRESAARIQEAEAMFEEIIQKHEELRADAEYIDEQDRERLDQLRKELDEERNRFAEEAFDLQTGEALPEVEEHQWDEDIASNDPSVPQVVSLSHIQEQISTQNRSSLTQGRTTRRKSHRKSPVKVSKVAKSNRRKPVTSRTVGGSLSSSTGKNRKPSRETDIMSLAMPTIDPENLDMSPSTLTSLLSTSFVLPPPSPQASLPSHPMNLSQHIPAPQFLAHPRSTAPNPPNFTISDGHLASSTPFDAIREGQLEVPSIRPTFPSVNVPSQRMVHAYSPVKPSPLSRVFVTTNSPDSLSDDLDCDTSLSRRPKDILGTLHEEMEPAVECRDEPFPLIPHREDEEEEMSLAQQLGIPDSPPDSSKRKRVDSSGSNDGIHRRRKTSLGRSRTVHASSRMVGKRKKLFHESRTSPGTKMYKSGSSRLVKNVDEQPKPRESTKSTSISTRSSSRSVRDKAVNQAEKENKRNESKRGKSVSTSSTRDASAPSSSRTLGKSVVVDTVNEDGVKQSSTSNSKSTNEISVRARLLAKLPPSSRGVSGPRRILVESPEELSLNNRPS
ncbi:hypothetical protein AX17_005938 [Amanita inopinata Kibby_2008]|nr:hypothetical protein AX17_005938 [Amanita inopinata Kibby_2008]